MNFFLLFYISIWSISPFLAHNINLNFLETSFITFGSSLILWIFILKKEIFKYKYNYLFFIIGLVSFIEYSSFYYVIQNLNPMISIIAYELWVIFMIIFSWFILKNKFPKIYFIYFFFVFLGVSISMLNLKQLKLDFNILYLIPPIMSGLKITFTEKISNTFEDKQNNLNYIIPFFFINLTAFILIIISIIIYKDFSFINLDNEKNIKYALIYGFIIFGIGLPLTNKTIDSLKCKSQTMWFYLVPFVSIFIFILFSNKTLSINELIGCIISIVTLILYSNKQRKKLKKEIIKEGNKNEVI